MTFIFKLVFLLLLLGNLGFGKTFKLDRAYPTDSSSHIYALIELMNHLEDKSELAQLKAVNDFFNQIPFKSDLKTWNKKDYWATRTEFLTVLDGDCEDYVIAKYFTLIQLGIASDKLYLTYVKAIKYRQSHMVLSYYPQGECVPLILDNLNPIILPASQRKDLRPIFNFNAQKIYLAKQRGLGRIAPKGKMKLDKWTDLILKIKKEHS